MVAQTFTVQNGSPSVIYEQGIDYEVSVFNIGDTVVYLDDTRGVTPANGTPLGVGATKAWPRARPLFAIAGDGDTGRINVGVPGEVTDPSIIAAQIIAQGLAEDIADEIASSSLSSDIGTSVQEDGTYLRDTPSLVGTLVPGAIIGQFLNTSAYQTLILTETFIGSADPSVLITVSSDVFNPSSGLWEAVGNVTIRLYKNTALYARIPIIGTRVTISSSVPTASLDGSVYFSQRETDSPVYQYRPFGTIVGLPVTASVTDGLVAGSQLVPASTSNVETRIASWSGLVNVSAIINAAPSAGAAVDVRVCVLDETAGTGDVIAFGRFEASGPSVISFQFLAPATPIKLRFNNSVPGSRTVVWALSQNLSAI